MSIYFDFISIAIRNLVRQRRRTLMSLCTISIGVACLIIAGGFVKDILYQLGEATIQSQTGHIQIANASYWDTHSQSSYQSTIKDVSSLKRIASKIDGLASISERIKFVGMLNNGKRDLGVLGEGIEINSPNDNSGFQHFIDGRALQENDQGCIVLGQGVAQALSLKVGDYVTLIATLAEGALNTSEFQVVGIFQSFSKEFDSRAIKITFKSASELLDGQGPQFIVLNLQKTEGTSRAMQQLMINLSNHDETAKSWQELSDFYEKTVRLYEAQFGVLQFIVFLMVLLSVANSIQMSLFERTREFGTLLALGEQPQGLLLRILSENLLLGVTGSLLGIAIALIVSGILSFHGIAMPPPPNSNIGYLAHVRLDIVATMTSASIGVMATISASIYPAFRASRISIIDALRHGV